MESDYPLVPYKKFVGQPSVLRAIALDWSRDFDTTRVAKRFGTREEVVRRILAREEIQQYLSQRLLPMESYVDSVRHRLFEEVAKDAFNGRTATERLAARKMLANTLLPEMKTVKHEHHFFVEAPAKVQSVEDWTKKFAPSPPILDAEVIEDDGEE